MDFQLNPNEESEDKIEDVYEEGSQFKCIGQ